MFQTVSLHVSMFKRINLDEIIAFSNSLNTVNFPKSPALGNLKFQAAFFDVIKHVILN